MNKTCSQCGTCKNIDFFYKNKKWKHWVEWKCKECRNLQKAEYYKQYYDKHKEKFKEYSREYFKSDTWKMVAINRTNKRRGLIKNRRDWSCSTNSLKDLLIKQSYECCICNKDIIQHKSRHLDHIIPLSKWGQHTISNMQWLCIKCNLHKSDRLSRKPACVVNCF